MTRTEIRRTIDAPLDLVFRTVADIREFAQVQDDIIGVEFLTESRTGVGTRFRETRRIGKREASTELEVTELVENERIRLVSDAGGTVWDSQFSVTEVDGGTELVLVMDARPYKLLARLATPLMKGMLRRALARDMDAVKTYCEGRRDGARPGDEPGGGAGEQA